MILIGNTHIKFYTTESDKLRTTTAFHICSARKPLHNVVEHTLYFNPTVLPNIGTRITFHKSFTID